ncbi:MAG TPA: ABC transporter permease [Firmicutes bacterium]|nr:ABC transporter permease [Bacillota bacterium]
MLNYIKSELYKTFHRKYLYIFTGICCLLCAGVNLLAFFANEHFDNPVDFGGLLSIAMMMFPAVTYLMLITTDIVFSDEYKHGTLKNAISYGVPRWQVYFGKLLVSIFVTCLSGAVILGVFLLSAFLVAPSTEQSGFVLQWFWAYLGGAVPIWISGISLAVMLFSIIRSSTAASFVYAGVLALLGPMVQILQFYVSDFFASVYAWLPMEVLGDWSTRIITADITGVDTVFSTGLFAHSWATGVLWIFGTCLIGYLVFRKKEIK